MLHRLIRPVLGFSAVVFLPILLLRAQPYDANDLRIFLNSAENCPVPCFLGIRPGVTSAEEAAAILFRHDWVRDLEIDRPYELEADSITSLRWHWTEESPAFIRLGDGYGAINMNDEIVETIYFESTISLGQLLLAYGPPDETQAIMLEDPRRADALVRSLLIFYEPDFLGAMVEFDGCPGLAALPNAPTTLYIADSIASRGRVIFDDYSAWPIVRDVFECSGF